MQEIGPSFPWSAPSGAHKALLMLFPSLLPVLVRADAGQVLKLGRVSRIILGVRVVLLLAVVGGHPGAQELGWKGFELPRRYPGAEGLSGLRPRNISGHVVSRTVLAKKTDRAEKCPCVEYEFGFSIAVMKNLTRFLLSEKEKRNLPHDFFNDSKRSHPRQIATRCNCIRT